MTGLKYSIARAVSATTAPPIPKARAWAQEYISGPPSQPLLDLSQGFPRNPPHPSFTDSLSKVSSDPDTSRYGPILGEPAFRDAYATEMNLLYGLDGSKSSAIGEDDICITTGCNMAFLAVVKALCAPNTSSALLTLPAYFNLGMSLSLQSVKPVYIPCDPDNRFVPSLSAARTYLENATCNVKPKMIILVSPSNPTGTIFTHQELKQWFDLAKEFEVALVVDETYKEFVESEDGSDKMGVPHELFKEEGWRETLISLGSFSKGYRIPGHRLGSIIAAPELLEHITTICDCMQICAPRPPQLAIAPLLPSLRSDILESSQVLAARRALFKRTIEAVDGWTVASMGAYYAYVSFPSDYLHASSTMGLKRKRLGSEDIAKTLAKKFGVITLPGSFFMPNIGDDEVWDEIIDGDRMREDRWIRFAVANVDDDDITQVGDRLRQMNELMGMA